MQRFSSAVVCGFRIECDSDLGVNSLKLLSLGPINIRAVGESRPSAPGSLVVCPVLNSHSRASVFTVMEIVR